VLTRRPSRLARLKPLARAAPGAVLGGAVGFWLEHGLTTGAWRLPLALAVAGGAMLAVVEAAVAWAAGRFRAAAERPAAPLIPVVPRGPRRGRRRLK
jgi:hypothetical protein